MVALLTFAAAASASVLVPQAAPERVVPPPGDRASAEAYRLTASYGPQSEEPRKVELPKPPLTLLASQPRGAIVLPGVDWDGGNAALRMKVVGLRLGWSF